MSNPYRKYEEANGKDINYMPGKEDFKGGDSKPDFKDKSGKLWMAKKSESKDELVKRAEADASTKDTGS